MAVNRDDEWLSRVEAYLIGNQTCKSAGIFGSGHLDLVVSAQHSASAYADGDRVIVGDPGAAATVVMLSSHDGVPSWLYYDSVDGSGGEPAPYYNKSTFATLDDSTR